MEIRTISGEFTVCKVTDYSGIDLETEFCFTGKTDQENSLVCRTEAVPENICRREDGWRCFRIEGVLDFSLIGILAKISTLLAEEKIGIFVISTFNTDYFFVKREQVRAALGKLRAAGYRVVTEEGA